VRNYTFGASDIITFLKRLQWAGHIARVDDSRIAKNQFEDISEAEDP